MQPVKNLASDVWISSLQRMYCNQKKIEIFMEAQVLGFIVLILTVVNYSTHNWI
jgi:hypothetical protein